MTESVPAPNLRNDALSIWRAAVNAVRPDELVARFLADPASPAAPLLADAKRIVVVGAGKAGAAMAAGAEQALEPVLARVEGLVNVPAESVRTLQAVRLHAARPAGSNHPTAEGVAGTRQILDLVRRAGPDDVVLALWSGGGSALLPAPAEGLTLEDKQGVTRQLHACGAAIGELNAVRKHLSASKGGRVAQAFAGRALISLLVSDVVGDPLDVIASGPTASDATTYADALAVLDRYRLTPQVSDRVVAHLRKGAAGELPETLKETPAKVRNFIVGSNAGALTAAEARARQLGYAVLNLGSFIEGETRHVAKAFAGVVRSIRADGRPTRAPVCLLSGGETTVTLAADHGLGGRNQEFVLALAAALGPEGLEGVLVLSGGTDGEDGPTDAAGALADAGTLGRAGAAGFDPGDFLLRNDAYHFFQATGDLLQTGLTGTNVMDVRVVLVV
jgi:hydroxypyruvate reductase/glycerate 2-kinase